MAAPVVLPGPVVRHTGDDDSEPISDAELTALALSADPDEPLGADAVPLDLYPEGSGRFLPTWYMPPVMRFGSRPWQRWAIAAIILAFLAIDALGLCSTYGLPTGA